MKQETKQCQNCKKEFNIESQDIVFYEKINVPSPSFCPDCRSQRRLAVRNERTLYKRKCDLCKKDIISMYSANKPYPVYCYKCWWGDDWDPLSFGKDIDWNKPFFEQYYELQNTVPRLGIFIMNSVNSEYLNYSLDNKNCYMGSRVVGAENCSYMYYCLKGKDCLDCSYTRNGELLYGCFETRNCYNSYFLIDSESSVDCAYSYDLRGCSNCLFCSNLRHKQYCVKNKQVSKEEFQKEWEQTITGSRTKMKMAFNEFMQMYKTKAIHRYNKMIRCVNSKGINLINCKNVYNVFYGTDSENVRYADDSETARDCMDINGPMNTEYCYESCSTDSSFHIFFSSFCENSCHDIFYSNFIMNSHDCFGCVCLRNGEYCILNKKYTKEEYLSLKDKIIEQMKKNNEWGENVPIKLSPFGYNETAAMEYFPLTKEQATVKGYPWENTQTGTYSEETISQEDINDNIEDVKDDILKQILVCVKCKKNYRLSERELTLYKKMKIPIPEKCPECRYQERLFFRPERKLYKSKCAKCNIDIETTYAPERPEIVYCEDCYKIEVN